MSSDFDEAYEDDRAVYGEPYPALLECLSARPTGRLLDLGCGQGRNAVPLAALGHEITAVDASAVGVAQTVAAAEANGDVVHGVATDLAGFSISGQYDVVLIDMVLHALDDEPRSRLLTSVRAAVAPKGMLYAVVPEPGPLVDEVVARWSPWPSRVTEVTHRLVSGEHAGEYTFVSVIGERPED